MLLGDGDAHHIIGLVIAPASQLAGDPLALAVGAQMAVDQGVHTQVLVGGDLQLEVGTHLSILRPDTQYDLLALVGLEKLLFFLSHVHSELLIDELAVLHGHIQEVHGGQADEAGHEQVGGRIIQLQGRADLLDIAHGHTHDPVSQGQGLDLVMGDVDHGGIQPLVQQQDLTAGGGAELGVQVGQGLVEEEQLGVADDGAAHGHTLPLAAGQLRGLLVQLAGQIQDLSSCQHLLMDDLGIFLAKGQGERHVFVNGHVTVESVVLEDHGHVTVLSRSVGHILAVDEQLAAGNILKACHHTQGSGLAAAGGTNQDDQFAVLNVQIKVEYCLNIIVIDLVQVLQTQFCHSSPPLTDSFLPAGAYAGPAAYY